MFVSKWKKEISTITLIMIASLVMLSFLGMGCSKQESLIISSTTSLRDSGLLDEILPDFTKKTGIQTKLIAVGTGKALQMGRDGEADVLLVHAKAAEEQFVAEGHGLKRWEVMYNDFVLVGPSDDPAQVSRKSSSDIAAAFTYINKQNIPFISRGDNSGTDQKEKFIWETAGIDPQFSAYISTGSGMADVLRIADEKRSYTLTDRGTYLKLSPTLDLSVIVEGDPILVNMYGVIAVNPKKNKAINAKGAQKFIKWILSTPVQEKIGEYAKDIYGQSLFIPLFPEK